MAATTAGVGTAEKTLTFKGEPPKPPGLRGGCGSSWRRSSSSASCRSTGWSTSASRRVRTCRQANIFPPHPSLSNYRSIFNNSSFTRALANSAIVSLTTTLIGVVVGSFAAYALARLKMRGKFILLGIVLSITTFPQIAIAAPLFKLWTSIGLYNTLAGLIIPYLTFALPLSIYILVSFFREIPRDLEEAALVDGATNFEAFRKVVVPLAAPGLATTAILTFIAAWNEFLLATTLTSSTTARTVPVAISQFTGATQFEVPLGSQSAASVVISIPLIVLVLLFQKRIVAGLTAGAVKG